MTPQRNDQGLDDALNRALGSGRPQPDFGRWQQAHPEAVSMLTSGARPAAGRLWRLLVPAAVGGAALAAAIVLLVVLTQEPPTTALPPPVAMKKPTASVPLPALPTLGLDVASEINLPPAGQIRLEPLAVSVPAVAGITPAVMFEFDVPSFSMFSLESERSL